jgi:pyruvate ferredoxin oxidoreductase alpha subunit
MPQGCNVYGEGREMIKVMIGNHAVSYGVMLSRVQVIPAYPITPQTSIVEELSEFCADGHLDARFIKVESEHSAMACCIGASAAGARTFTATSSQGLALMHEMLHWATGARLPIVMANVNRALGPPWNIWNDQTDSLSQRDTGWLQFYCESNQEVLDTVIQSFKISEEVLLPTMLVLDAFFLSHTAEAVDVPDAQDVDRYLPRYQARYRLDVDNPHSFGNLATPEYYQGFRNKIQDDMIRARTVAKKADEDFESIFHRSYGFTEAYQCEGADLILVTSGTVVSTSRIVIDELRKEGRKVGLLKIRMFRPFPFDDVIGALKDAKKVAVLDRAISFGHSGIFAQEIMSAMYNQPSKPLIYSYITGLGGLDVTPRIITDIINDACERDIPPQESIWIGGKS